MNYDRNQTKMSNGGDGSALLHHLPWPRGSTYDGVCQMYVNHVKQRYGTAVIVFDGYTNEPSTKDATHLRRTGICSGVTVHFTGDELIRSKKEESWHIRKISNGSLTISPKN